MAAAPEPSHSAIGTNTITIVVTAQDGSTTLTTTLVATRASAGVSSDASLASLVLSQGGLSPAFAASTTAYSVSVANTVTAITVTPGTTASTATVRINGASVASGSASAAIALAVGTTTVSVVVSAEDGVTTRTYTITVGRASIGSCTITPQETQGPYPLLAILSNSAMVRSDITEGKTGVPLRLTLTLQDLGDGCTPVAGAAVYIWHCDKDGLYSGYSNAQNAGQAGLTYLRGIQVSDANGQVHFTTIYPGWYAGRITHVHFQVYLNDNLAVTATATSQLAFPPAVTSAVYDSALYTKGQNSSVTGFASDNVFSDGTAYQLVSISGDTSLGYDASLTVTLA
ncbi:MAG: cadherin-like beta sandwich domain-containing protein [Piscinibacter sp.]